MSKAQAAEQTGTCVQTSRMPGREELTLPGVCTGAKAAAVPYRYQERLHADAPQDPESGGSCGNSGLPGLGFEGRPGSGSCGDFAFCLQ